MKDESSPEYLLRLSVEIPEVAVKIGLDPSALYCRQSTVIEIDRLKTLIDSIEGNDSYIKEGNIEIKKWVRELKEKVRYYHKYLQLKRGEK